MSRTLGALVLVLHCAVVTLPAKEAEAVAFDSERWKILQGEVVDHLGRNSFKGTAVLQDVALGDGTIEVDIAVTGARSYPGILFRRQSAQQQERFYVRPHRAGLYEDALQYTPVFHGIAGWQLYAGPGYTASSEIPAGEWIPIKLEMQGSQARVYVGGAEQPALRMLRLEHGQIAGAIGVMGPVDGSAYFSNFRYRATVDSRFASRSQPGPPRGMLTRWTLSQAFPFSRIDTERAPTADERKALKWQSVRAGPSGLIDIARYVERNPGESEWIWARTSLQSSGERAMPLRVGYSDEVAVFLNGSLLFRGDSSYRSRDSGFSGIVGLNDLVTLPLQNGENELLLLVGESFGGWGFMAQDAEASFRHEDLIPLWDLKRTFNYPESVVYDEARDVLYVSNYYHRKDEFISKVRVDGTVVEDEWVTGLQMPTGLCLAGGSLFVVERRGIAEIDIESGEVRTRYAIEDAGFPNDVACSDSMDVFVSDTGKSRIYRLTGGQVEVWLEDEQVQQPNGLYLEGSRLVVGASGDGCLKSISLNDRSISDLACFEEGSILDGIRGVGRGRYLVTDFRGRMFLVSGSGERVELLDTTPEGINTADLEYVSRHGMIVIPSLYTNRLRAYRFKLE